MENPVLARLRIRFSDLSLEIFRSRICPWVIYARLFSKANSLQGFGSSFSSKTSLAKSISEFYERAEFKRKSLEDCGISSSNGFATHHNATTAEFNAISELFERHFFLSSWLENRPPEWLFPSFVEIGLVNYLTIKLLAVHGCTVKIGLIAKIDVRHVIVCSFQAKYANETLTFLDTKCDTSLKTALKALLPTLIFIYENLINSAKVITSAPPRSPLDHLMYNLRSLGNSYWYRESGLSVTANVQDFTFQTQTSSIDGLYTVSASSTQLIPYFCGAIPPSIASRYSPLVRLNTQPHPLS